MFTSDVLCIGSATIDHFLIADTDLSKVKLGDKVLVAHQETHSGGGGTNSAAALSKLGLKVKLLTKLGNDLNAKLILEELKSYRMKVVATVRSRKSTDTSTILSSLLSKDRIIFVHKGASGDLSVSDLRKSYFNTKWVYLASLTGKSFRTGKKIIQQIHSKKIKLLFNPSLYLASLGEKKLKPFLRNTTVLVLNKEEAQALAKIKLAEINNPPKNLLIKLQQMGPSTVVITDGAKKLSALHKNKVYSFVPPKVKVVETAGAGDAFTSGVLAGLIKNYPFDDALRLGQVNALSVIQHIGTKNKLLTERETELLIKKYNLHIHVSKV